MKAKKTSKKFSLSRMQLLCLAAFAAALLIGAGSYRVYWYAHNWQRATDQVAAAQIRDLVLRAVDGLVVDAPIEPKTGDVYFPQAKLMLPNVDPFTRLTYHYDTFGDTPEFSISSRPVINQMASRLYKENVYDVFTAVPDLQKCQRGLRLQYSDSVYKDDQSLRQVKKLVLNNGKTIYVYSEGCKELEASVLPLLDKLQAY